MCEARGLCDERSDVEATSDVIISDDVSLRDGESDTMVARIADDVAGVYVTGGNFEDVI